MRFVAGRGAVAERLQRGGAVAELLAGALRRKAIGKMLLAGALRRRCWPGHRGRATAERRRRGGAAGWGAKVKSHQEDAAGQGRRSGRDADAREIHREEGKKHARRKSSIGKNMHLSFQMNKI